MRTYFCFLIPRTDVSARLYKRCALLFVLFTFVSTIQLSAQKCPGGLDSIQQVCVTIDCGGAILISWDAHPGKCYTFSIPSVITHNNVSSGRVILTGSGTGISTGTRFYVNESCGTAPSTTPCQPHNGGSSSVDIYAGTLPNLGSLGTWKFEDSKSANTKDDAAIFTSSSPSKIPDLSSISNVSGASNSIIRPSGVGTSDAEYCVTAQFNAGSLDSLILIGNNTTGVSSGMINSSKTNHKLCLKGISAGSYTNDIIVFKGRCRDTLKNILTVVNEGSDIPTLACYNNIQVSIKSTGSEITPAMMLPGQSVLNKITFIEGTKSNILNCSHDGQKVKVVVLDTIHNQKCWGYVLAKDKSVPRLNAIDTIVSCLMNMDSLTTAVLLKIDNGCSKLSDLKISHSDVVKLGSCNSGDTLKVIERIWIVKNKNGIIRNATSTILVKKVPFDTIVFPRDTTIFCPDTSFALSNTGGININIDSLVSQCKLQVGYTDKVIPTGCDGMKKIERFWLAIDWCNNIMKDTSQFITLRDTVGPVITCPRGDRNGLRKILTSGNMCAAHFLLPKVEASDHCSEDSLITHQVRVGGVLMNKIDSVLLPVGQNIIEYIAHDDCGNSSSCMDTIIVEDGTHPTIDGPTILQVTHSGTGKTEIPVSLFSKAFKITDNCALDSILIRRMTTRCGVSEDLIFGSSVNICCADSDTLVPVELRAVDTSGLSTNLMVMIDVKDGTPPVLSCIPDTIINLAPDSSFVVLDSSFYIRSLTDNCGLNVNVTLTKDTFKFSEHKETFAVVVTAQDIDFGIARCTVNVTVIDTVQSRNNSILLGLVADPFDNGLSGMNVTILNNEKIFSKEVTNSYGLFEIENAVADQDLSVRISGYGEDMSGVSSLDLFLMQKHILGIQNLDNNYLKLAADIDQSGDVSVRDLISLQNSILNLRTKAELPWMFLETNKTASNLVFGANDVVPIVPSDIKFTAVKMGDLNGDVYSEAFGRTKNQVDLMIEDKMLHLGEADYIPLTLVTQQDGLVSFVLDIGFTNVNNVQFVPNPSIIKKASIEWQFSNNSVRVVGYGDFSNAVKYDLGSLKLNSNNDLPLSAILTLNESSEYYNREYIFSNVKINWLQNEVTDLGDVQNLFDAFPNPAVDNVSIQLNIPISELSKITITDITGKLIMDLSDQQKSTFSIPTTLFPSSGSYLISVESDAETQNDILLINKK